MNMATSARTAEFAWVGSKLEEFLERHCARVPVEEAQPGDILVFWIEIRGHCQHVGVLVDEGRMVHAHSIYTGGMVREESLSTPESEQRSFSWERRIMSAWRMRPW